MNDRDEDRADGDGDADEHRDETAPPAEGADGAVPVSDSDEDERVRNPTERGTWTALVIGLLGAWLVVSPWVFGVEFGDAMGLNSVITGAALALLGGFNYSRRTDEQLASAAGAVLAALLGLWLLVSPWVFELSLEDLAGWNYVVAGFVVGVLGLYTAYEARDRDVRATGVE